MLTRAWIRRLAMVAALVAPGVWTAHPAALAAELGHDFRDGRFDNDSFLLFGKNSEQLVKPIAEGLSVRIPPGLANQGAVGFTLRPRIRGDFEITATYRLLDFATPPEGTGIRVKLTAVLDGRTKDRISIERAAIPKEGNVCTSTVTEGPSGKARRSSFVRRPSRARTGRLRMARTGGLVKVEHADGGGPFRSLRTAFLGTYDASRVSVVLDPGRSTRGAAILLRDLTIRAEGLDMPAEEPAEPAWRGLAAGVATMLLVLAAAAFLLARRRRKAGPRRQPAGAGVRPPGPPEAAATCR